MDACNVSLKIGHVATADTALWVGLVDTRNNFAAADEALWVGLVDTSKNIFSESHIDSDKIKAQRITDGLMVVKGLNK